MSWLTWRPSEEFLAQLKKQTNSRTRHSMTHSHHWERCESPVNTHLARPSSGVTCFLKRLISPPSAGQGLHSSQTHSNRKRTELIVQRVWRWQQMAPRRTIKIDCGLLILEAGTERHLVATDAGSTTSKDRDSFREGRGWVANSFQLKLIGRSDTESLLPPSGQIKSFSATGNSNISDMKQ